MVAGKTFWRIRGARAAAVKYFPVDDAFREPLQRPRT